MECKTIKQLLPDYLENNLEQVEKNDIKLHISSCEICSEELKELKKYKKELTKLPRATAPDDFLNNIYEKLEKPPLKEKIKNILLLPLKMPKESLGVAILAFVVFFYFNSQEQLKQAFMSDDNSKISDEAIMETSEKEEEPPKIKKMEKPKAKIRKTRSKKSIKIKKMEPPLESAADEIEKTYIIVLSLDDKPKKDADKPGIDSNATMKKEETPENDVIVIEKRAAETKNTTLQFVVDDEEAIFKRKVKKVKQIAASNKANILQEDLKMSNKKGKYIILEVPASEYINLVNSLNNIGTVKNKSTPSNMDVKRNLKLKIELMN